MMLNLMILSTTVFFLVTAAFANEDLSCKEIELGASGKKHWSTSLTDGLKSEVMDQLEKNDDLFEKTTPEIPISFGDFFDFNIKTGRSIGENLPLPSNGKISAGDLFSLKVNNMLTLELEAKASTDFLFTEATAGTQIMHSSDYFPGQELSSCEVFAKILMEGDLKDQILDNICTERQKSKVATYYEKVINGVSHFLGLGLKKLSDSEKNRKYSEDPLAGLKIHSSLGIPIDHEVFFENSNDLNINDIIEHTSYYAIKPIGLQAPLIEGIKPRFFKYRRHFRSVAFQKKIGNKVQVEISDTILKGNTLEYFKLRPKLFNLIKLNFGFAKSSGFDQESLMQRFSIDLNHDDGMAFFKELLRSLYTPSLRLNKNSVLIDSTPYTDGVVADFPVYRDGDGEEHRIRINLFGVLTFDKRDYYIANHIKYNNQEFSDSQKLVSKKVKNKIGLDLGLFTIDKKDKNLECKAEFLSDEETAVKEDSSLNITCNYKNQYADNDIKQDVADFINVSTNGSLRQVDKDKFEKLDYTKKQKINFYTNISFNHNSLQNILNHTEEEVYAELSKLFFGENMGNLFSSQKQKLWKKLRPAFGPKASAADRYRTNSKDYRECKTALKLVGIVDSKAGIEINESNGLFGGGKGVDSKSINRCYYFYTTARDVVAIFNDISTYYKETGRLSKLVKLNDDARTLSLTQALMVRLAGGIETNNVRYSYVVLSPLLDTILSFGNGKKYQLGDSGFRETLTQQAQAEYVPRVDDIKYTYNTCLPKEINAHFTLKYPVEDRSKVFLDFKLKGYSTFVGEDEGGISVPLSRTIRDVTGEYHTTLVLLEDLDPNSSHNVFFSLKNDEGMRLSREYKVYLGKIKNQIEDDSELEEEEN